MRNYSYIIAVIIALIIGIGIGYFIPKNSSISPATVETTPQAKMEKPAFKVVVLGQQNDSKQVGYATLTEENGKVKVTLKSVGAPDNVPQPAHIHAGSCPTPGAIVFPLSDVVNGNSETIIDTTIDKINTQLPLAVNIHESKQNIQNYAACGNVPD